MNGFVFRDEGGRPVGYLQRSKDRLACRIGDLKGEAELLVFYADEGQSRYLLASPEEQEMRGEDREILAAAVRAGGRLICDTGAEARRRLLQTEKRERKAAAQPEKREEKRIRQAEKTKTQDYQACAGERQRERRWPPPPCMPMAVYEDGRWRGEE